MTHPKQFIASHYFPRGDTLSLALNLPDKRVAPEYYDIHSYKQQVEHQYII